MDRSYLTHPGIVAAGWEGCLLYPVLWLHSEDGRLDEGALAPAYLSVITRAPEGVCATGLKGLEDVGLVVVDHGVATIKACFSSRVYAQGGAPERLTRSEKVKASQGGQEQASEPARESVPPREGGLEEFVLQTWGEQGKALGKWCQAQETAHPEMDLVVEAKKAHAWNVGRKKPRVAIRRFLASWFNRADGFKEDRRELVRMQSCRNHWSSLTLKERDLHLKAGKDPILNMIVEGVSVDRDLRNDQFVLSGQDITRPELPYRGALSGLIKEKLGSGGDPYEQETLTDALKALSARAENNRALSWAVDQIVTDVRYELGLLPV